MQVVLTGRIFQRGEILVIGAELVNVRDGSHLWGQQYKRQLTDIFAIEDELSREISGRLRAHFTAQEQVSAGTPLYGGRESLSAISSWQARMEQKND